MNWLRKGFLIASGLLYQQLTKRVIFKWSAQAAHEYLLKILVWADRNTLLVRLAAGLHRWLFVKRPLEVGGVVLDYPFMVAAGLVKGVGFASEEQALMSTKATNIIPGWRILPALLGTIEFGSFTRYPRLGNSGTVMWRHENSRSTQNRVGLKNPGARLAAQFLSERRDQLPPIWGINIAVSPGVTDEAQSIREIEESLAIFLQAQLRPTWFTLNISCPNTEDDPGGNQTEQKTRFLCRAAQAMLRETRIPLWVKISPDLSENQYEILLRVFQEEGVAAVIATNTLAQPTPEDATVPAGVGGGVLHGEAMKAVAFLTLAKMRHHYTVDIIGCGGLLDGNTYRDFKTLGVAVVQYWSALVFRGPLAAPIIESELPNVRHEPITTTVGRASVTPN